MGTFTAQILVGHEHRYGGGIIPSHALYLSENSKPAWLLNSTNLFDEKTETEFIRWIPTIENMLDDAMLLIGIYVIKDEALIKASNKFCKFDNLDNLQLYEAFSKEDLQTLYEIVKSTKIEYSIALTIFNESSIINQYNTLDHYKCKANVFTVSHINY